MFAAAVAEGAPPPWTEDPILQKYSFTNVRREDDRVTRWIAANWRVPHATDPALWFAMSVSRFVNWPDTMMELGYPVPWSREHFIATLQERAARDEKVWGDAYNISNGGQRTAKAEHVAAVLDRFWQARKALQPRPDERLAEWHGRLVQRDGLGSFMAAQIVADMKYAEPLKRATDWTTFAASGPGSKRGLNRVLGRPVQTSFDEYAWRVRLKELHESIKPELQRVGLGDLHAQDLQNCLCEFDKYQRVKLGEGHPKRRFSSAPAV
jgi:alpha-glutamyl/putrescinyl thymine pyrophosphorylase clade 1